MTKHSTMNNGIFSDQDKKSHVHSEELAAGLEMLMIKQVLIYDIGAGDGYYAKRLRQCGFEVNAYDGNPAGEGVELVDVTEPMCIHSLSAIICLEVAEHIPKDKEEQFLANVFQANKVIISWAVPGQGGSGHVNEQPNIYVIGKFQAAGYKFNYEQSAYLRSLIIDNCWWFKHTLMVFDR